jgi:hypothetical protein
LDFEKLFDDIYAEYICGNKLGLESNHCHLLSASISGAVDRIFHFHIFSDKFYWTFKFQLCLPGSRIHTSRCEGTLSPCWTLALEAVSALVSLTELLIINNGYFKG